MSIDDINLSALDLNLLVALDALLTERSVTRAAKRVGVGQPAMSHSLKRLRVLFEDPLFVRVGRDMQPTPRAEHLAGPLRRWLAELRSVLHTPHTFHPGTSKRRFTLITSDLLAAFLPAILECMQREAPHVQLNVQTPRADPAHALNTTGADLALAPPQAHAPGMRTRTIGRITWASFLAPKHPALKRGKLTIQRWTQYPHITVNTGSTSPSFVASALDAAGLERHVGLVVPSFLVAPYVVARTHMIFTAPRELIEPIANILGLVSVAPPLELPAIPIVALWPERLHAEPAHVWLRNLLADVVG